MTEQQAQEVLKAARAMRAASFSLIQAGLDYLRTADTVERQALAVLSPEPAPEPREAIVLPFARGERDAKA